MLRRFLFDLVLGRELRRFRSRRRRFRRKLSPGYLARWVVRKVVGTVFLFVILAALILWYFHAGALDAVVAGDASVLSLIPLAIGRWFELAVAFVVAAVSTILPNRRRPYDYD